MGRCFTMIHKPGSVSQTIESVLSSWPGLCTDQMDVDKLRSMEYRVGINLLNRGPAERGIEFLINRGFINLQKRNSLKADIAHFMLARGGLSKKRITEYLLDTEKKFNREVLKEFVMQQQQFKGKPIDEALRNLLSTIKLPPNAKTENLMQFFAERYVACNPENGNEEIQSSPSEMTDVTTQIKALLTACPRSSFDDSTSSSSVNGFYAGIQVTAPVPYLTIKQAFLIATEIIAINHNFHVPSFQRRPSIAQVDFLENMVLRLGVDFVHDDYLMLIYRRIKETPLPQGEDHVDTVLKKQHSLKPDAQNKILTLCSPSSMDRRFILQQPIKLHDQGRWNARDNQCFQHNRELMIFNDIMLITEKIAPANANASNTYRFCCAFLLAGLQVRMVTNVNSVIPAFGIQVVREDDNHVFLLMSSRNEQDRLRIFDVLKDAIIETKMTNAAQQLLSLQQSIKANSYSYS